MGFRFSFSILLRRWRSLKSIIYFLFFVSALFIGAEIRAQSMFYHLLPSITSDLTITPATATMKPNYMWKYTASLGTPPYSYSIIGNGSIDPVTGVFTASGGGGYSTTIRVTDSVGAIADATAFVSPVPVYNLCTDWDHPWGELVGIVYDSGGPSANYTNENYCDFEIYTPNPVTLTFSAFDTETTNDYLRIRDWNWTLLGTFSGTTLPGNQTDSNGYLYLEFRVNATVEAPGFVAQFSSAQAPLPTLSGSNSKAIGWPGSNYSVSGGVNPYTFSILSGAGTLTPVDGTTVFFTPPASGAGTTVIRVVDGAGSISDKTVTITDDPITITSINPTHGAAAGGGNIWIYGTGFKPGLTANLGGNSCTPATASSSTSAYCTIPAGSGFVDVTVTNADLTTATLSNAYQYDFGTTSSFAGPNTTPRSYHVSIWTGDRIVIWGGQDPSCAYATCTKSDGFVYNPVTDSWTTMAVSPLGARINPAGVWTGSEVIVYGGRNGTGAPNDGAKYNPYLNTWISIAAPAWQSRQSPSYGWTGTELTIYGGQYSSVRNEGAAYNPTTNTWRTNIPTETARWLHSSAWSGRHYFQFGGSADVPFTIFYNTGSLYDPFSNTRSATTATNLQTLARGVWGSQDQTAVIWTGQYFYPLNGPNLTGGTYRFGILNPETSTWSYPFLNAQLPTGLNQHVGSFNWTGSHILGINLYGNAFAYSEQLGKFYYMTNAYNGSLSYLYTGKDLIACFGFSSSTQPTNCQRVDAGGLKNRLELMSTDAWINTNSSGEPSARSGHSSIWTGKHMIVWGGSDGSSYLNSGYKYDPVTDAWSAISTASAPSGRTLHTALWGQNRMMIWGGQTAAGTQTNTGGVYNPYTDSWTAISTTSAPSARESHSAVWAVGKMIIFGGQAAGTALGDGARYDLAADTWSAVSSTSAPAPRYKHTALWNGAKMFVWGGRDGTQALNDGALYDLAGDSWSAVTTTGAPSARFDFAAIRTGLKFVVWGGSDFSGTATNTGAVYDSVGNSWTATSTGAGALSARKNMNYIFTDRFLILLGGQNSAGNALADGAFYNPQSDTWSPMTSSGLSARYDSSMIWTGNVGDGRARGETPYRNNRSGDIARLVVWGGYDGSSYKSDGQIYNPPLQ